MCWFCMACIFTNLGKQYSIISMWPRCRPVFVSLFVGVPCWWRQFTQAGSSRPPWECLVTVSSIEGNNVKTGVSLWSRSFIIYWMTECCFTPSIIFQLFFAIIMFLMEKIILSLNDMCCHVVLCHVLTCKHLNWNTTDRSAGTVLPTFAEFLYVTSYAE